MRSEKEIIRHAERIMNNELIIYRDRKKRYAYIKGLLWVLECENSNEPYYPQEQIKLLKVKRQIAKMRLESCY